jgi:20S proteasome alpha/beta subunit
MEAISQSGLSVGLLTSEGVILAAEKKMSSKLLDTGKKPEKMYKIDDHIACAVAGITSDANILVNFCRLTSQRYLFQYDEAVPMEHLLMTVCDTKQGYTQYGGANLYCRARPAMFRSPVADTVSRSVPFRAKAVRCELSVCRLGQTIWFPAVRE